MARELEETSLYSACQESAGHDQTGFTSGKLSQSTRGRRPYSAPAVRRGFSMIGFESDEVQRRTLRARSQAMAA